MSSSAEREPWAWYLPIRATWRNLELIFKLHHNRLAGIRRIKRMLDDRAKLLLKALVERYITEGQPVGSRTLSRASGLELSPATIRNVMSDLEELGLIVSPHTSAGRVPTAKGYRLFVDTMLKVDPDSLDLPAGLPKEFSADQPVKVLNSAAQLLSNLSQFVGVVVVPKRNSVFRHIEFLSLSERRVLIIIVSPGSSSSNSSIAMNDAPESDFAASA